MDNTSPLDVFCIVSLPLQENTYVVRRTHAPECVVVDPGLEPELILDHLGRERLGVAAILNTHGHGDHIGGNATLKEQFPDAPLVIGELDAFMLTDPIGNFSAAFGMRIISPPADRMLREGDVLEAAGMQFDVLHIPGHSPGHIVFVWRDERHTIVLGGDVLFAGSVGRTDMPGGDHNKLVRGIREKLFALPDDTIVYPGHGPETTLGIERVSNPFVGTGRAARFTVR